MDNIMGKYSVEDWGVLAVKFILKDISEGIRRPPFQITMKLVGDSIGTTPQNIGLAAHNIEKIMNENGYSVRIFGGTPRKIEITSRPLK